MSNGQETREGEGDRVPSGYWTPGEDQCDVRRANTTNTTRIKVGEERASKERRIFRRGQEERRQRGQKRIRIRRVKVEVGDWQKLKKETRLLGSFLIVRL